MTRHVYSAWDGHQDLGELTAEELLQELTDDLLHDGDLDLALQKHLRHGHTAPDNHGSLQGFENLLRQLTEAREVCLQRYAADSFRLTGSQVQAFTQRVENAAQSVTAELAPYHQAFPAARYQRHIQEVALQHRYQMISQRLDARQGASANRQETEISNRLRHLLTKVQPNSHTPPAGTNTSPHISTLLKDRARFLQHLHAALNELDRYLDRVDLVEQKLSAFPFTGSQPLGLAEAERLLRELYDLDGLFKRVHWHPGTLVTLKLEHLQELLRQTNHHSTPPLEPPQLAQMKTRLEQAGFIRKTENGLQLSRRGAHQIGANVLRDMFRRPSPWQSATAAQPMTALTGETKPYEFGDALGLDLGRTLINATQRQPGVPVQLHPADFEVYRYEPQTQQATVLVLDMSHSMERLGQHRFTAAKKVALALARLIRSRFPHDRLHIVGFGDRARQLQAAELPYAQVGREHTNTQSGLRLARQLLGRQRTPHKQIMLITDGRPTAVEHNGELYCHTLALHPIILAETYKEAKRCQQQGITLNTFMLADNAPLIEFVQRLTAVSRGRAFYTTPKHLGGYVIEDYLRHRRATHEFSRSTTRPQG